MPVSNHLRYAWRLYRRSPGYTTLMIVTLGVGVTPALLVASLLDAIAYRPLPYPQPERLMRAFQQELETGDLSPLSLPTFRDLKAGLERSSEPSVGLATFERVSVTMVPGDAGARPNAKRFGAAQVSDNFFDVLAVRPLAGRTFVPGEDLPGAPRVVMLSHRLWQRAFAGAVGIVGRMVQIDGQPHRVVGIVPAGQDLIGDVELWLPFNERLHGSGRFDRSLDSVARLAPGVAREVAEARVAAVAETLYGRYPEPPFHLSLLPFKTSLTGRLVRPLAVLLGLVVLVLLAASTNVAALAMARLMRREHEMAIRMACGSDVATLRRQVSIEGAWLTGAGALLGLMLTAVACSWTAHRLPVAIPAYLTPRVDARIVVLGCLLLAAAHTVITWLPARAGGLDRRGLMLRSGHRALATTLRQRWRRRFVQVQAAAAFVLICATISLVRDAQQWRQAPLGFDPTRVTTFHIALSPARYPAGHQTVAFFRELRQRLTALPDIATAAFTSRLPTDDDTSNTNVWLEGWPEERSAAYAVVTPGYFDALAVPIVHGRAHENDDDARAELAVVVSREWARQMTPGRPEGSLVGTPIRISMSGTWGRIVGVVGDAHYRGPGTAHEPYIYLAQAQFAFRDLGLLVATEPDTRSTTEAIDQAIATSVAGLDPAVALFGRAPLHDQVAARTFLQRFVLTTVLVVALVVVGLTLLGLFGMVALLIDDRRHALAIRLALGARSRTLRHHLLRQTGRDLLIAVLIGSVIAALTWPLLARLLASSQALMPSAFLMASALLLLVSLTTVWWCSRRIDDIDPNALLRLA